MRKASGKLSRITCDYCGCDYCNTVCTSCGSNYFSTSHCKNCGHTDGVFDGKSICESCQSLDDEATSTGLIKKVVCGSCGCRSLCSWFCWSCEIDDSLGANICDACKGIHDKVKVFKTHKTVRCENMLDGNLLDSASCLCSIHVDNPIQSYCNSCSTMNCAICEQVFHQLHVKMLQPLASVVQAHRSTARNLMNELEVVSMKIAEEMSTVTFMKEERINRKNQLDQKVNKHFNGLIEDIEKIRAKLHQQTNEKFAAEIQKFDNHATLVEQQMIDSESFKHDIAEYLSQDDTVDPVAFIRCGSNITARAIPLVERPTDNAVLIDLFRTSSSDLSINYNQYDMIKILNEGTKIVDKLSPKAPVPIISPIKNTIVKNACDVAIISSGVGFDDLVFVLESKVVSVFGSKEGNLLRKIGEGNLSNARAMAVMTRSPREDSLLYVCDSIGVKVFNIYSGAFVRRIDVLCSDCCINMSSCFNMELFVVVASTVQVFDAMTGVFMRVIMGTGTQALKTPCYIAVSPQSAIAKRSARLLVCDSGNRRVQVFEAETGRYLSSFGPNLPGSQPQYGSGTSICGKNMKGITVLAIGYKLVAVVIEEGLDNSPSSYTIHGEIKAKSPVTNILTYDVLTGKPLLYTMPRVCATGICLTSTVSKSVNPHSRDKEIHFCALLLDAAEVCPIPLYVQD